MYLYAYTARQIYPNGKIETICGSWSRDDPISTLDEYTKTAKEIVLSCGFDNGVITSFSLIYSPNLTKQTKTIEQHRAEFEEWVESEFKGGGLDKEMIARYAGNNDLYHHAQTSQLWRAWQAARGITE